MYPSLSEEHKLGLFVNRTLKAIFGPVGTGQENGNEFVHFEAL
jgi:hypothetical protein